MCNTSHLFLPKIYERVPEARNAIANIIDSCVKRIEIDNEKQVYLLASEGTIESQVYQNALAKKKISCIVPAKEQYALLRECIEAVKQDKYSSEMGKTFKQLVCANKCPVILGCTELPILYEKYKDDIDATVYDPLLITLKTERRI